MNKRFMIVTTALEIVLFLWIFLTSSVSALPPPYDMDPNSGYVGESLELFIGIYDDTTPRSSNVELSFEPEGIIVHSIKVFEANNYELIANITIENWASPGCYDILLYVDGIRVPIEGVVNCFQVKLPEYWINGEVFDNKTNTAIQNAEVYVERRGVDISTNTSWNGSFSLEVPSGMIKLVVKEDNYYQTSWTGQSKPGRIYIDFPLNSLPLPDEPAISSSTFSGEIKDANTGELIKGDDKLFFLLPDVILVEDMGDGHFKEEGLLPGYHFAVLLKWGYLPWVHLFELEEGETEMFTVELIPLWQID